MLGETPQRVGTLITETVLKRIDDNWWDEYGNKTQTQPAEEGWEIMWRCSTPRSIKTSFTYSAPHVQVYWSLYKHVPGMFCCVVTDQHNYATEKWHCVSITEHPFCSHCLSSFPFHWSSAHFNHQQCCPVLRQCLWEPEETALKRIDSSYSKSFPAILLFHWKYVFMKILFAIINTIYFLLVLKIHYICLLRFNA